MKLNKQHSSIDKCPNCGKDIDPGYFIFCGKLCAKQMRGSYNKMKGTNA
jgi:hypothetical protein